MKISQSGIDFIKSYEGYHRALPDGNCTTYYCPAGVLTIGYGCTEGITPGEVWTQQQAEDALRREVMKHEGYVQNMPMPIDLTQYQYDMLVSFSYNCGPSNLRHLLKRNTVEEIADALTLFNRGGGRILPGLVRRRAEERKIFLNGYHNDQARLVDVSISSQVIKEVKQASTKSSWIGRALGAATAGLASFFTADTLQIAIEVTDKIKEFASANVLPILCVVGVLLFIGKSWYDKKQAKDALERGNVPSKMEERLDELPQ